MKVWRFPPAIAEVCRAYYGRYIVNGNKWSPPNRCDSCPLREPCLAMGRAPAHTQEQLDERHAVFEAEAGAILASAQPEVKP